MLLSKILINLFLVNRRKLIQWNYFCLKHSINFQDHLKRMSIQLQETELPAFYLYLQMGNTIEIMPENKLYYMV